MNTDEETKVYQTFLKYVCFYCSTEILSENYLITHKAKCHEPEFLNSKKLETKTPSPSDTTHSALFSLPFGFLHPNYCQTFPVSNPSLTHFPKCDQCGWIAHSGTDLMNHRKDVHKDFRSPFDVHRKF